MNKSIQIRFCGFGGQGIVLMGTLLGNAAVRDGLWAAGSNSYGAQARGSACKSDLVISKDYQDFPYILMVNILVPMSQEAYNRFIAELPPESLVIYDSSQIENVETAIQQHLPIPATYQASKDFKNKQVSNVTMLAAAVSLTKIVSKDSLSQALEELIPVHLREINRKALEQGYHLGRELQEKSKTINFNTNDV